MSVFDDYLGAATVVQDDTADLALITFGIGDTLSGLQNYLELPGKLAKELNGTATDLDFPSALVTVLGVLPYGIGTAIKALDDVSAYTSDQLEAMAKPMEALDTAWSPYRTAVSVAKSINTVASTTGSALAFDADFRVSEAEKIQAHLGGSDVFADSRLGGLMDDYIGKVDSWNDIKDAAFKPVDDLMASLNSIEATFAAIMPDTSAIEAVIADGTKLFSDLKGVFEDIENLLCVEFVIVPGFTIPGYTIPGIPNPLGGWIIEPIEVAPIVVPDVTLDICGILDELGNQIALVQDFVEGIILDLLASLGFDLQAAIDELADLILEPLNDLLAPVYALETTAQAVIDEMLSVFDTMEGAFNAVLADMGEVVGAGTLFEQSLDGTDAGEALVGDGDVDAIFGHGGDDTLTAEGNYDFLFGGDGDDSLLGGDSKFNELYGGNGDDTMTSDMKDEFMDGGAGHDEMTTGNGRDTMFGGSGDDLMVSKKGKDLIRGGDGNDTVQSGGVSDTVEGGAGDDVLEGGSGADSLLGQDGADSLRGIEGADTLDGGFGDDTLEGNGGNDLLCGGDGNDSLKGGVAADTVKGGDGDDRVEGNDGDDDLSGANGHDDMAGGGGADTMTGDAGNDTMSGGTGADTLGGGADNDSLRGNDGADSLLGASGDDDLSGDGGHDTLEGGNGSDTLFGANGADILLGDGGRDTLSGGSGSDTLDGGAGNDTLTGNGGNDVFLYGAGDDLITDFRDNLDSILFDAALWGGAALSAEDILATYGSLANGQALFEFTDGTLAIDGVTSLDILADDIGLM